MKGLIFLICLLIFLGFPALAAQETDIEKSVVSGKTDPDFEVNIVTNPLNRYMRNQYHPEHPLGATPTYEEVVPYGSYYPSEGLYYETESPEEEEFPESKGTKEYYEDEGQYYSPPSTGKK